jgi:acyl carrier protein
MTESEIKQAIFKVLERIAPEADLSSLRPDDSLRETLDIDSFDFLQFIIGLHESFNIDIPESDYSQLNTLAGTLRYLAVHSTQ